MTKVKITKRVLNWKWWFSVETEDQLWKEQADIFLLKQKTKKDLRKVKNRLKSIWSQNHKADLLLISEFKNYPFVHACASGFTKIEEIQVIVNPFSKTIWDLKFITEDGKRHGIPCTTLDTYQFRDWLKIQEEPNA